MALTINTNSADAGGNPADVATRNVRRRANSPAYSYHRPHYHGHDHHGHNHHFCHSCCHPVSKCCCGHKHCRKESKELLVEPLIIRDPKEGVKLISEKLNGFETAGLLFKPLLLSSAGIGAEKSIIGGGCCVHLSVEYMLEKNDNTAKSLVAVAVEDSEDHTLVWVKDPIQPGYHIKEDIITVNPGARLIALTINTIARVRWCEVFSC
ncbi:MAG: hypothetical protein OEV42_03850 [Deltaproteobacteria bacterium]|nr:hypothetical protein [Deltaproteobacteria bacterium]